MDPAGSISRDTRRMDGGGRRSLPIRNDCRRQTRDRAGASAKRIGGDRNGRPARVRQASDWQWHCASPICTLPHGSARSGQEFERRGLGAGSDTFAGSEVRVDPARQIAARGCAITQRDLRASGVRSGSRSSTGRAKTRDRCRACSTASCERLPSIPRRRGVHEIVRTQRGARHTGLPGWLHERDTGWGSIPDLPRGLSAGMRG